MKNKTEKQNQKPKGNENKTKPKIKSNLKKEWKNEIEETKERL